MNRKFAIATLCSVLALSTSAFAGDYKVEEVKDGGTISGNVQFTGKVPPKVTIGQDTEVCGTSADDCCVTVGEGKGFANVVVYLKKVKAGKDFTPEQKKTLSDQKSCVFVPHVTLIAEGGEIEFKNSDKVLHNVKAQSLKNGQFNEGVESGKSIVKKFKKGHDLIEVACSVHPWMKSFIIVMPHPYYAVTDKDGNFKITDVPAGKYKLIVEHPSKGKDCEVKVDGKGGAQKKSGTKIKVKKGGEVKVEATFK